jgi:hypothetical protein
VNSSDPAKVIAGVFALAGFAVAMIAGLAAENSAARVLGTALVAMLICHLTGLLVGVVGERVVHEHVGRLRAAEPMPETRGAHAAATTPAGAARKG